MNRHPYVRAYLAGIAAPTVFLLVAMTSYILLRLVYGFPLPVERLIVFPMAVVPNLWGLWNILYVAVLAKRRYPLGLHGDTLALILGPTGFLVARALDFELPHSAYAALPVLIPFVLAVYYLVWKHVVGFLNAELGIA